MKNPKKVTNPKGPKNIWVFKVIVAFDASVSEITSLEGDEVVSGQWLFQTYH